LDLTTGLSKTGADSNGINKLQREYKMRKEGFLEIFSTKNTSMSN